MSALKEWKIAAHRFLIPWGIDIRRLRHDRQVLERVIFPYFQEREEYYRLLFVGCAWYTQHYPFLFDDREFVTMEIDPEESRFGGTRHIVDSVVNIARHFPPGTLDAVFLNGVYGFGLNAKDEIEQALAGIQESLRMGGMLVFGWNDTPELAPYRLEEFAALRSLRPITFPPLGTHCFETDNRNRHRYNFYAK